jgi:hypothetical protein
LIVGETLPNPWKWTSPTSVVHLGCTTESFFILAGDGKAAHLAVKSWLPSVPRRHWQILRLLAVVNGCLQHDDDGVGSVGLAAGWHRDCHDGEDGIWREKELLLARHVALLHQVHMLATIPARATSRPATARLAAHSSPERSLAARVDLDDPVHGWKAFVERHQPEPAQRSSETRARHSGCSAHL